MPAVHAPLPPASELQHSDVLSLMPAHRQLKLFRQKRLSPIEVLEAQIDRIESANSTLNALTFRHFDAALEAARASESRYHRGEARPLDGVTVAIKDEFARRGW